LPFLPERLPPSEQQPIASLLPAQAYQPAHSLQPRVQRPAPQRPETAQVPSMNPPQPSSTATSSS